MASVATQRAKGEAFRALHDGPRVLVIGSVWDPPSARVFEQAGFAALGTSSAGIAFALGFPDDEQYIDRTGMLAAVAEIARTVSIPVSADMLRGFGDTPEAAADTARATLAAGAVGINIEDSAADGVRLDDAGLQEERIRAMRAAAEAAGVRFLINARTDSYWLKLGDERAMLAESIRRANRYREAGADCLFVPGAVNRDSIATLVREIDGPINILTVPGCPPVRELEALGVRRVSQGSGPARGAMGTARRIARELLQAGTYESFHRDAISYPEANALFKPEE